MRKPIHLWWAFVLCPLANAAAQQPCLQILNCPLPGNPTTCDLTPNDSLAWNDPPFTWSNTILSGDLHETATELSTRVATCPDSGDVALSYTLFLDLDNDNLHETAVRSTAFPPPGKVLAGNVFNPGYQGGDTLVFDKRPVSDSLRYHFAIQTQTIGDTTTLWVRWNTLENPSMYLLPRMPEGRHRVIWRAQQGSTVRTCDQSFRVRDCQNPLLECAAQWTVQVDTNEVATLRPADIVLNINDNVTPDSQIVFSMRRSGMGNGFPLNGGQPVPSLTFVCDELADEIPIELWARDRADNVSACQLQITVADSAQNCAPPIPPAVCATPFWSSDTIADVLFTVTWAAAGQMPITDVLTTNPDGCAEFNYFPPTSNGLQLSAVNNENPLNGVSTQDIVLISRHILGTQPFDAPWKILAADINQSATISSFDIVELRKLLLGIYDAFPNNTSWRFFRGDCNLPPNPFGACPSSYQLPVLPIQDYPAHLPFKGLKVGDVNNSALANTLAAPPTERAAATLQFPDLNLKMGETAEIPLRWASAGEWSGAQFSLAFDPQVLEIESVVPGALADLSAENWSQTRAGALRFSWSGAQAQAVFPGDDLLRLRVRARSNARLSEALWLDGAGHLRPEAYDAAAERQALQLDFSRQNLPASGTAIFAPQPNPTAEGARWPVRLAQAETVAIEVFDLRGQRCWRGEWPLAAGAHWLECPQTAFPSAGVYFWRARAGAAAQSGRLCKM
jgi:hypothetical protein